MKIKFILINLIVHTNVYCQTNSVPLPPVTQNFNGPYDTGDKIPGNPVNGVNVLKRIFNYTGIYRGRHQGNYQSERGLLVGDMLKNPQEYGFNTGRDVVAALSNPDNEYSDHSYIRNSPGKFSPSILSNRPDNTLISSPKKDFGLDVLAYVDTYYHVNTVNFNQGRSRANPTGFYVVLYEDGRIDNVPFDKAFYSYETKNSNATKLTHVLAFPDQSGVPYNSLSYQEYWEWKNRSLNSPNPYVPIGSRLLTNSNEPAPGNGALEGLLHLFRCLDRSVEREALWQTFESDKTEFSLAEVKAAAQKLGLQTQVEPASLSRLQSLGSPAILSLKDDGRIVTLTSIDEDQAVVVESGMTYVMARKVLEESYSGQALLPAQVKAAVVAENHVRSIGLKNYEDEVSQRITIRNTSDRATSLKLAYPLPGVTEAKLSKNTLAPGETATLDLKIKWRSILKSPTQNVLVPLSIGANQPRLQLAFLLVPPMGFEAPKAPGAQEAAQLPRAEDNLQDEIATAKPTLQVAQNAPNFTAIDMDGQLWRLAELKGKKNLLLTFFPKCFTGGCANHLSSLRDQQKEFDALNTQILAVSVDAADGVKGQKSFAAQWQLQFPMIPDTTRTLSQLFGAAQNDKQLSARMSILIDKNGVVRFIDTNVNIKTHGADMLAKIRELGLG